MDAFGPFLTVRRNDFQLKNIGAAVVRGGVIKRDKCRHIDRQTLFDVGRFQRAALDNDAAVRRRRSKPDRRQRPGRAIGTDVDEEPKRTSRPSAVLS